MLSSSLTYLLLTYLGSQVLGSYRPYHISSQTLYLTPYGRHAVAGRPTVRFTVIAAGSS